MTRNNTLLAVLLAVLIALGLDIVITIDNSKTISTQVSIVCTEHRELARIAKEEAEEGAAAQLVTARINIPGLTHTELLKLTNKKQAKKEHRASELQIISSHTC